MLARVRQYYILTKPGIIRGNALAAIGGYLLAAKGSVDPGQFLAMLVGLSLIIASACVANNYIDRDIDRLMRRTHGRALAAGTIGAKPALLYCALLGIAGVATLLAGTNLPTLIAALTGFVFYVFVYTPAKRRTVHGTLIGSVAGAMPPVVGYLAVAGRPDLAAGILFIVLILWQVPHFYAIALYRKDDYKTADIPVLPIVSGSHATKTQTVWYIAGFIVAALSLSVADYTGITYTVVMSGAGAFWLITALRGYAGNNDRQWARRVFGGSLLTLTIFCAAIAVNAWMP